MTKHDSGWIDDADGQKYFSKEQWRNARIKEIEDETRRRMDVQKKHFVAVDPNESRMAGTQDLTDYDTRVPWQKEFLDRCGEVHAVNRDYRCIYCGQMYNAPVPPRICINCGHEQNQYKREFCNMHR